MHKLIHQVGLVTSDGESFGVVFTDENAVEAIKQVWSWAYNSDLSLTFREADLLTVAIMTRDTSNL